MELSIVMFVILSLKQFTSSENKIKLQLLSLQYHMVHSRNLHYKHSTPFPLS